MVTGNLFKVCRVFRTVVERLVIDGSVDKRPRKRRSPESLLCETYTVFEVDPWIQHISMPHHKHIQRRQTKIFVVLVAIS